MSAPQLERKLATAQNLTQLLAALPRPLVMTNGVFDLLHRGHVAYLQDARALGAALVVAVNSDASVRRLGKGPERPLNTVEDRMALLAALEAVDLVLAFDEDTAEQAVLAVRPDIYVKGGDYQVENIPEGRAVLAYGGQVRAVPFAFQRSTTALVQKIRKQ
ncbi:D-glycero-beta-D-manno-heptose 1-phosphate adenylyltransferase [Massilia sp. W12]|uniref:D-glycero-beta-D-manno-heptose 1-phosphate adenylyltransferase n=1 Tax=Massilia sp. W12 TaxID=3126507 RepID=UPI0030CDC99D